MPTVSGEEPDFRQGLSLAHVIGSIFEKPFNKGTGLTIHLVDQYQSKVCSKDLVYWEERGVTWPDIHSTVRSHWEKG